MYILYLSCIIGYLYLCQFIMEKDQILLDFLSWL
jgi:hypothetical protein